ncbi:MAG: hypothetical protein AAB886_01620 [Patescibacteria group bacterium]
MSNRETAAENAADNRERRKRGSDCPVSDCPAPGPVGAMDAPRAYPPAYLKGVEHEDATRMSF